MREVRLTIFITKYIFSFLNFFVDNTLKDIKDDNKGFENPVYLCADAGIQSEGCYIKKDTAADDEVQAYYK